MRFGKLELNCEKTIYMTIGSNAQDMQIRFGTIMEIADIPIQKLKWGNEKRQYFEQDTKRKSRKVHSILWVMQHKQTKIRLFKRILQLR